MKYVVCRIGLLAAVVSLMSPLSASAAEPSRVVISEINWAGSVRSTADEWFELTNIGGSAADINGWVVSGVASSGGAIHLATDTPLAAGTSLVVANYSMSESSTLAIAPDLVTTAVSLANRALNVMLLLPDGTVVDSAIDAGDIEFGSAITFASMERDLATLSWQTAAQSNNLLEGQAGTPGTVVVPALLLQEYEPTTELSPEQETVLDSQEITDIPAESATDTDTVLAEPELISREEPPAVVEEIFFSPVLTIEEIVITEMPIEEPAVIEGEAVATITEPTTENITEELPVEIILPLPLEIPVVEEVAPDATPEEYVPIEISTGEEPQEHMPIEASVARIGCILLSEFVSSPTVGDEWIEVVNADMFTIDVTGWTVVDASGKATTLAAQSLLPGAYLVIQKPLGKLNNDGDTITLKNYLGDIADSMHFDNDIAPATGQSLAWDGASWVMSAVPTPAARNMFPAPSPIAVETILEQPVAAIYAISDTEPTQESTVSTDIVDREVATAIDNGSAPEKVTIVASVTPSSKNATSDKKPASDTKIATVKRSSRSAAAKTTSKKSHTPVARAVASLDEATIEERVQLTGTLIALPGTFGSQIAVLEGAILYLHSADWPSDLTLGDIIRVEGIVSESRGEKRIKVDRDSLAVLGHEELIANVMTDSIPALVHVKGRILGREGDELTLDVNGEKINVRAVSATGITWGGLTATTVSITGVLRTISGERILMPRSLDDVQFLFEETLSAADAPEKTPVRPWVGAGLLTSSGSALGYWFLRSRRLNLIES